MGIFDLLSKEGRAKGALDRYVKRVSDKFAQSPDRFAAMDKLREIGSADAYYGIARRFSFVYDKGIEDEQEKEYAAGLLADAGKEVIGPLRRYLLESGSVSYALGVLGQVAEPDLLWPVMDELLAKEDPGYTRDPDKKIQLITWLSEWKAASGEDVNKRIVPYLADFDENVRFTAVDALTHHPHESAMEPLLNAMLRKEEESRRVKRGVAELLGQTGWVIPTARKEEVAKYIAAELPDFGMHHDKLVKKTK